MTSKPLVRRTLATLRSAEFGFFGVVVYTRVQTPRFCGQACSAGTLLRAVRPWRCLRINWLMVGIDFRFPKTPLLGADLGSAQEMLRSKANTRASGKSAAPARSKTLRPGGLTCSGPRRQAAS